MSARKDIFSYIKKKGTGEYTEKELHSQTSVLDPGRVIRQLNQDKVIRYNHDKSKSVYVVYEINKFTTKTKRSGFSKKVRYSILHRDGRRCQACGKGADEVLLHVDHKVPVDWGGNHSEDNLWTLCAKCNLGKKAFFKDDFDPEVMRKVFEQKSGTKRLQVLFEESPNKKFTVTVLQGISGIRDWTRTIRKIRKEEGLNIVWHRKTKEDPKVYYEYIP